MPSTGRVQWRPGASRRAIEARAELLADIRSFFADRGVLEVETPVLSHRGNTDPNIESIRTDERSRRCLRTSPEFAMKRLLAAGSGDIYELGRVFRAGEAGRYHNPEFTMLEWYRVGMPYLELSREVVDLARACGRGQFDDWPVHRFGYRELFLETAGLDPWLCSEDDLADCAAERGIATGLLSHGEWLDLLMAEVIQPSFAGERFTIVCEFPPEQAALARISTGERDVAERFEVFLGHQELANGYQELTDPDEQLRRFERENRLRAARGQEAVALDTALVEALHAGLPECSGVALGVDRLLMSLLGLDHIDAVLAFSFDRA